MQFIKTSIRLLLILFPGGLFAQSTTLPQGYKHQQLMDRLEIKLGDSALQFQHVKPFSRKQWVAALERIDTQSTHLSAIDRYNIGNALMNNYEWVTGDKTAFNSRKPFLKTFYKTKSDFALVDTKDFFLSINPVIQQTQSKEKNNSERLFLNSKGVRGRGLIAGKIGFDFYVTDNQERLPAYADERVDSFRAVPGAGFYKPFKTTGYDYIDARGSMYFNVTKYIDVQFGYDKNFIGNGYRSMFLSDFANNTLFLKLKTHIWKLQYENIFMELNPKIYANAGNVLLDKKYAAMHHLSYNATRWLNIGFFESIIFGRPNRFEFGYLNPVIFLRSIEQQSGSPDNANIGFDFKANIAKSFQFYGQVLLDEFVLKELRNGDGWWGNKFGVQLGGKYIDAFKIKNLDLQGEVNLARPYTYSHYNEVANYTHYNQPLAHPLGANFAEMIGILRYQPLKKLQAQIKVIGWRQGIDTGNINYGANIFKLYTTRPYDYGFKIAGGVKSTGVNASLWLEYEVFENVFIDGSFVYRKISVPNKAVLSQTTNMFTLGVRMNVFRKEYDY
jgi:hypothetical protein